MQLLACLRVKSHDRSNAPLQSIASLHLSKIHHARPHCHIHVLSFVLRYSPSSSLFVNMCKFWHSLWTILTPLFDTYCDIHCETNMHRVFQSQCTTLAIRENLYCLSFSVLHQFYQLSDVTSYRASDHISLHQLCLKISSNDRHAYGMCPQNIWWHYVFRSAIWLERRILQAGSTCRSQLITI